MSGESKLNDGVCQKCEAGFTFRGMCANHACGGGGRDGMTFATTDDSMTLRTFFLSRSRVVTKAGREMWAWSS